MSAHPIGRLVRLQVQTDHLKQGTATDRWYDPAPIEEVFSLQLTQGGVVGLTPSGSQVHDVHHRDHPKSRFRGDNGVSIGFTSHYEAMRGEFGEQVTDGVAGENLLLEGAPQTIESLGDGVIVVTTGGAVRIGGLAVAEPCVEFAKFCLNGIVGKDALKGALSFLGSGVRGFYATFDPEASEARELRTGDLVYREADLLAGRR